MTGDKTFTVRSWKEMRAMLVGLGLGLRRVSTIPELKQEETLSLYSSRLIILIRRELSLSRDAVAERLLLKRVITSTYWGIGRIVSPEDSSWILNQAKKLAKVSGRKRQLSK